MSIGTSIQTGPGRRGNLPGLFDNGRRVRGVFQLHGRFRQPLFDNLDNVDFLVADLTDGKGDVAIRVSRLTWPDTTIMGTESV